MPNYTDYRTAVKWGGTNLVMLNSVCELDENFVEDNLDVFYPPQEEEPMEFYQFYITDWSDFVAEYNREVFGLDIAYSNKLNAYILCVPHYGTSWDYVPCEVLDTERGNAWWEVNGNKYGYNK